MIADKDAAGVDAIRQMKSPPEEGPQPKYKELLQSTLRSMLETPPEKEREHRVVVQPLPQFPQHPLPWRRARTVRPGSSLPTSTATPRSTSCSPPST